MLPTPSNGNLRPLITPLAVHKDRCKALHVRQLLGRPSCFEPPFAEQLSKPHQVGFGLELFDACVDVGHLVIVFSVASDVGSNAPIVQLLGSVDKHVEDGQLTNEKLMEPLGNGVNGL